MTRRRTEEEGIGYSIRRKEGAGKKKGNPKPIGQTEVVLYRTEGWVGYPSPCSLKARRLPPKVKSFLLKLSVVCVRGSLGDGNRDVGLVDVLDMIHLIGLVNFGRGILDAVVLEVSLVNVKSLIKVGTLSLELLVRDTELSDSLLSEELFEGPLLNVGSLVGLESLDELHSLLKDRTLVLLTARNDLRQLINTLIDGFAAASFNLKN